MMLGEFLQALMLLVLGWIGLELRSLRDLVRVQGERVARLEEKVRQPMRTDSFLALALVALTAGASACAAAGSAALGAVGGAAVGGGPGALAGALGGLIGSCWTTISSALGRMVDWLGGSGTTPPLPPSLGAPSYFARGALGLVLAWILFRALTSGTLHSDAIALARKARAGLTRLLRRP